jgi:enoyl-CoA hydratase
MEIRLEAPDVRNAISQQMALDMEAALGACSDDPELKALIITGTDPAFCSGVDLRDISEGRRVSMRFFDLLSNLSKPTIGVVNGVAATGGFELALACDIRIGSERAAFVDRHAQLGMIAGGGMSVRLVRLAGYATALEISLTGRRVGAIEAHRLGLLNSVVEHDALASSAYDLADIIAGVDSDLCVQLLDLYRKSAELPLAEALSAERRVADEWRDRRDRSGALENFKALDLGKG